MSDPNTSPNTKLTILCSKWRAQYRGGMKTAGPEVPKSAGPEVRPPSQIITDMRRYSVGSDIYDATPRNSPVYGSPEPSPVSEGSLRSEPSPIAEGSSAAQASSVADEEHPADTNTRPAAVPKFVEVFSPTVSLVGHPLSVPTPGTELNNNSNEDASDSEEEEAQEEAPKTPKTNTPLPLPPVELDERFANNSSLLGTQNNGELYSFRGLEGSIFGYYVPSYVMSGSYFVDSVWAYQNVRDMLREEYAALWLDVQFFWDLMLRMQPNPISNDPAILAQAVDLMMDFSAARLALDARDDCSDQTAQCQIREFRRRIQRFDLILRSEMGTCGARPKLLCGCLVNTKQFDDKNRCWTKLFVCVEGHESRPDDRRFKIRDIARMLRLEDFLSHASREVESELGNYPSDSDVLLVARSFFDPQLREFVPDADIETVDDMKNAWILALCNPDFRKAVVVEVQGIVKDAISYQRRKGHKKHRVECEHYKPRKSIFSRRKVRTLEPVNTAAASL